VNRHSRIEAVAVGIAISVVGLMAACATFTLHGEETVGQQFRNVLSQIDRQCRDLKSGPYLDRSDPQYRKRVADTSCNILMLKPRDWREVKLVKLDSQPFLVPEHWLTAPEGHFAHSIHLPEPSIDVSAVYHAETSGAKYFDRLCGYAGERVFKTANAVRSVRQDRSWISAPNGYQDLVFWVWEKGGIADSQDYLVQPPFGGYESIEVRLSTAEALKLNRKFRVYYREPETLSKRSFTVNVGQGKFASVPYIVANAVRDEAESRFAFTWRGIWPTGGLEHGIEGFELIVYQIEPFEVLAYQRDFWRHLPDKNQADARITHTESCAQRLRMSAPHRFLQSVLIPGSNR